MSARRVGATAHRVLAQLRHDPRTVALVLFVPSVLMTLLRFVYEGRPQVFDAAGAPLLSLFPLTTMFLITSIALLREHTGGTLERLLSTRSQSSSCCSATASRSARSQSCRSGSRSA